jgi:hypothetical protein
MMKDGCQNWEFDLRRLPFAHSIDLGMWVAMNALIDSSKGRLKLRVGEGSAVAKLIAITQIDKVLKAEKS